jgi:hypothetical protein
MQSERRQGANGGTSSRGGSKDVDGKPVPVVQKKGRFSVSEVRTRHAWQLHWRRGLHTTSAGSLSYMSEGT